MSFVVPAPKDSVNPITDAECTSLHNNTGIDPTEGKDNCEAIAEQILPLIKQELDAIKTGKKTIFANEDSKCKEGDENPTLASILSRIYRMAQAIACNICTYDPDLVARLKTGNPNQVLRGQGFNQLPVWVTPDASPIKNSTNVATSGAVYDAIRTALLGTFHLWEGHENFAFYAETLSDLNSQTGMSNGDKALVLGSGSSINTVYTWDGSSWTAGSSLGRPENFATFHVAKGTWTDKELYFFYEPEDSTATWNLLDADLGQTQALIDELARRVENSLQSADSTQYLITTRTTLTDAMAVPATAGKTTIVLITQ